MPLNRYQKMNRPSLKLTICSSGGLDASVNRQSKLWMDGQVSPYWIIKIGQEGWRTEQNECHVTAVDSPGVEVRWHVPPESP
jgi:hypothetical protein